MARRQRRPKRIPKPLQPLVDDGVITSVVRQLQSGKEATVYVVECDDEWWCAKAYKDSEHRSFQKVSDYNEGRKTRRSRDSRALEKRSRHGRRVQEEAWKNAEVEALYRLIEAGVRVPQPFGMYEGVLIMEYIHDGTGNAAPRLSEVDMTEEEATEWHAFMMSQIVRMLCADVIHGDLSEFNVLVDADGPVVIDLPQAVAATGNNQALRLLARDVENMRAAFSKAAPKLADTQYARELWYLYESGELEPDTVLTGRYDREETIADVEAVLEAIEEARIEAEEAELARQRAEDE